MTAKAIGRRLFSKATMGVPLVLKGGAHNAAPPPALGGYPIASKSAGTLSLGEKIWVAVRKGTRAESERADVRYTQRYMTGGLDLDLSVLNSMSHQHRIIRQIERIKAEQAHAKGIRATIIKAMGRNPEDFE